MEDVITISLAIGIPLVAGATRPTRGTFAILLAIGLGYVTVRVVGDDWHPSQLDDLAWAAIVYGLMSALIVGGWFVGRTARRRVRPAGVGSA